MTEISKNELRTNMLFNCIPDKVKELFNRFEYPWQVLPHINAYIMSLIGKMPFKGYTEYSSGVWIGKGTVVAPSAVIVPPCIIGKDCEVRPGAYIRGNVIIGDYCVIGNSTEIKNSIIFDHVQLPHYNYIGDSIIGCHSHMGAGAVCSNQKQDKSEVCVKCAELIPTGLGKLGAILADNVEVGCGSVLNPGTVIMRNSRIYPLVSVRGVIPADTITKSTSETISINDKKLP